MDSIPLDSIRFTDRKGRQGEVAGTPGTNFGLRLTAYSVLRLEAENGIDNLPFDIMAAGYGDDEDWAGLSSDDIETIREAHVDQPEAVTLSSWWGPFEVWATLGDSGGLLTQDQVDQLSQLGRFVVKSPPDDASDAFWVNDTTTDRTVSLVFDVMADAVSLADAYNRNPSLADPLVMTEPPGPAEASEALDTISAFVSAASESIERGERPDIDAAFATISRFIKQVADHGSTDLEWGEPGDCLDRLDNDDDLMDEPEFVNARNAVASAKDSLRVGALEEAEAAYDDVVKRLGLGRHYGDPHCIWCLQAS